jgi:GTP cyclohydrolase I
MVATKPSKISKHGEDMGFVHPSAGAVSRRFETAAERKERVHKLADHVRGILELLGEDPEREGIVKTPERYAKALLDLTQGYEANIHSVVNDALFEEDHEEMVIVKDIQLYSLCEHHMVPIVGTMTIAYIPNGTVIGLSKLARIAEVFARRLQVQERLTKQVAETLMNVLKPQGVAVVMKAGHMCMSMRGVQKSGSETITSSMLGVFREDSKTREEFLRLSK